MHLLAVPTLAGVKHAAQLIAGNLFVAFLVLRFLGHLVKSEWGRMITFGAGAVIGAGIIWVPDQTISMFIGVWRMVIGS